MGKQTTYTEDIHRIEIGFSPSDAINEYITSTLSSDFNINQYTEESAQKAEEEQNSADKEAVVDESAHDKVEVDQAVEIHLTKTHEEQQKLMEGMNQIWTSTTMAIRIMMKTITIILVTIGIVKRMVILQMMMWMRTIIKVGQVSG